MSLRSARVSVGLLRTKFRLQVRNRSFGSGYCGTVSAPRSIQSSGPYGNGKLIAEAATSNTGHMAAWSSTSAMLSMTSVSAMAWKLAIATVLPETSCAQVTVAEGLIRSCMEHSRSSWLSRGRSISRCGPRATGRLYRYVVRCRIRSLINAMDHTPPARQRRANSGH